MWGWGGVIIEIVWIMVLEIGKMVPGGNCVVVSVRVWFLQWDSFREIVTSKGWWWDGSENGFHMQSGEEMRERLKEFSVASSLLGRLVRLHGQ